MTKRKGKKLVEACPFEERKGEDWREGKIGRSLAGKEKGGKTAFLKERRGEGRRQTYTTRKVGQRRARNRIPFEKRERRTSFLSCIKLHERKGEKKAASDKRGGRVKVFCRNREKKKGRRGGREEEPRK